MRDFGHNVVCSFVSLISSGAVTLTCLLVLLSILDLSVMAAADLPNFGNWSTFAGLL